MSLRRLLRCFSNYFLLEVVRLSNNKDCFVWVLIGIMWILLALNRFLYNYATTNDITEVYVSIGCVIVAILSFLNALLVKLKL